LQDLQPQLPLDQSPQFSPHQNQANVVLETLQMDFVLCLDGQTYW
jgi:hypothetical protein